jgi:hypothetical protein
MTALPSKGDLNGSSSGHNQGMFKAAIGGLRDFLSGLLGTDGTQASALAALKVLDPQAVYNLKPEFTVGTNALTCTVKDRAGGDLSANNPGFIGQRSGTPGDGGFTLREITANVALTISSGSTLGHSSGVSGKIYWYLLDNAGAQVLAACGSFKGFSGIYSTTAEGGAGSADSDSVLYAVGAHSDIPGRLIAVTTDSQTTAGTWANAPSQVDLIPQALDRRGRVIARSSNTVLGRDNHGDTINVTATYTQTLESAASLGNGWFTDFIVNTGATLTLDPNSTETVDGSETKAIVGPASGRLVCNGTVFRTIGFSSVADAAFTQCQLIKSGSNIVLLPYGGNQISINGVVYTIPSAGVSLAPPADSGVNYHIYVYNNSGTLALEASTTAPVVDSGKGLHIKSGDATRTHVGLARTVSSAWVDTLERRLVCSRYNQPRRPILYTKPGNQTGVGAPWVLLTSGVSLDFVTIDGAIDIRGSAGATDANAGAIGYLSLGINSGQVGLQGLATIGSSAYGSMSVSYSVQVALGYHSLQLYGGGVNATFNAGYTGIAGTV